MIIAYFDEAGDDGFPIYSSPLFVLSCVYFHYQDWQSNFQKFKCFKSYLSSKYHFPFYQEIHAREFLTGKGIISQLNYSDTTRVKIIGEIVEFIAEMDFQIINVVINKTVIKTADYQVLDKAFTYAIQRIENDLNSLDPSSRFMIITDPGRLIKMRTTARKIQQINFLPSRHYPGSYRQEIKRMIEDPLPKDSKESYFIQMADLVSFIVYHYMRAKLSIGKFPNRMPCEVTDLLIEAWLEKIKPRLNLKASGSSPFGIVCYPK